MRAPPVVNFPIDAEAKSKEFVGYSSAEIGAIALDVHKRLVLASDRIVERDSIRVLKEVLVPDDSRSGIERIPLNGDRLYR